VFEAAFDDAPARLGDSTQVPLRPRVYTLVEMLHLPALHCIPASSKDGGSAISPFLLIENWLNEGRKGTNGELNDEEDAQLNPLRTAYLEGWNRAEQEG
jgi:hypothetical protein